MGNRRLKIIILGTIDIIQSRLQTDISKYISRYPDKLSVIAMCKKTLLQTIVYCHHDAGSPNFSDEGLCLFYGARSSML